MNSFERDDEVILKQQCQKTVGKDHTCWRMEVCASAVGNLGSTCMCVSEFLLAVISPLSREMTLNTNVL